MHSWSRGGVAAWSGGGCLVQGGSCLVRGVGVYLPGPGGGGTCLVRGGVPTRSQGWGEGVPGQVLPPPVNRMTHTCKNITLAKTSFRPVKMLNG